MQPPPPISSADPLVGRQLGEYQVLGTIGEGGMGVVYLGLQPVIKKRVAIKVLKAKTGDDQSQVQRLIDEAEAVNSIGHRNIVDIFGLGQLPDGHHYIVMEYLDGEGLDVYLKRVGRLPVPEAVDLLLAICSPLAAAHRANVIHRDLKPSNVFLCREAEGAETRFVKLLDFGLAKRATSQDGTSAQTLHTAVGTPDFMAPEQARGLVVSTRTDIYALGVTAFELLTGVLPFSGETPMDVIMQHLSAPPPPLERFVPDVPPELASLVARMLAKSPDARPQSVAEVRTVLAAVSRDQSPRVRFAASPGVSGSYSRAPLRRTVVVAPGVAGGGSLGAAAAGPSSSLGPPISIPYVEWRDAPAGTLSRRGAALVLVGLLALGAVGGWALFPRSTGPKDGALGPASGSSEPTLSLPLTGRLGEGRAGANSRTGAGGARGDGDARPGPGQQEPGAEARAAERRRRTPPRPPPAAVPSAGENLRARVERLEDALRRGTPSGEEVDPTALTLLKKYRLEAAMPEDDEARARLGRNLDEFERAFLGR